MTLPDPSVAGNMSAVSGAVATLAIKDTGNVTAISNTNVVGRASETKEQKMKREEAERLAAQRKDILMHEKLRDSMFYI